MGASVSGQCYGSGEEAGSAQCAAAYPLVRVDGAGQHVSETCAVIDATHLQITATTLETAAVAQIPMPVAYPDCNPAEHYEILGGLFVLALAGLMGVLLVRMSFHPLMANQ